MLTGRLLILARRAKERVTAGEERDAVLTGYVLLSEAERAAILAEWDNISTARTPGGGDMADALQVLGVDVNG